MSDKTPQSSSDISSLAQLRDEVRVQAHLLKAEALERFDGLELRWEKLRQEALAAREIAGNAKDEVGSALSLAIESLRNNYTELKNLIRH